MKKILFATLLIILALSLASAGGSSDSYSQEGYAGAIGKTLGHKLEESERSVANATYDWYQNKWEGEWTEERFKAAVEKGVENCQNGAMLAAAKTGKAGTKLLKALVVTAGDAVDSFSNWVDEKSERFDKERKERD